MATYMRTGRISWSPLTDTQRGMLAQVAQYNVGEEFTATLDTDTEAFLIGEGVIARVVAVAGGLPAATMPRQAPMWTGAEWVADGVPRVVRCPFAFDTPAILTGADLFAPAIGDVVLGFAVDFTTPWDAGASVGFSQFLADTDPNGASPLLGWWSANTPTTPGPAFDAGMSVVSSTEFGVFYRFTTADPVKVIANATGAVGGPDPGATQGEGCLYMLIATTATG